MADNEVFDVVELDQGDGWTRVRRPNLEEGFVPTSYLALDLFEKQFILIFWFDQSIWNDETKQYT